MHTKKDKEKIIKQAKKLIAEDKTILFIEDLVAELPISKPTLYKWFPKGSEEYNELLELIEKNKIIGKKEIRAKLRGSDKASELLAVYRMICTDEERKAIAQNYVDINGSINSKIEIGFVSTDHQPAESEDEVEI